MSLDQFVTAITTLSSQANYAELCDHLNKSQEVLQRNPGQLDRVLESLEPCAHSLGYLATLVARLGQVGDNEPELWSDLVTKCDNFVSVCNDDQIRFSPNSLSDLCHILTSELVKRGPGSAIRGISILVRAIRKLQVTPTSLTPVHADLAKLCLMTKCLSPALPFLDTDINLICKENGQFDAVYLLLYYYYGGCIYSALKKFDRALFFFEVCVTTPTAAVSHIMLEAYKKYQLVGLLVHGDKPKTFKDNFSLPKFTSPLVGKFLKPLCAAYSELVSAYTANNQTELRAVMTKHQEVFIADNNMGLVRQVMSSQVRSSIRRLTRTFITLSLADLATRVGLSSPQEVEAELVSMIQAGSIQARISQQDGMVSFDTNPESFSSPSMLGLLEAGVSAAICLDRQVSSMEEEMMMSPAYVKKMSGSRTEEDDETGNRMGSYNNAVSASS